MKGIPGIWDVGHLVPCLVDQGLPDVKGCGRRLHRDAVITAFLFRAIIKMSAEQDDLAELRFLSLDDIADIEKFVVPGIQRCK